MSGEAVVGETVQLTITIGLTKLTVSHVVAAVDIDGDVDTPETRPENAVEISAALVAAFNADASLTAAGLRAACRAD